jgi:hypothetical protein
MRPLSVHLRLEEDHSGLPFHPSCPVCRRDRLAGSLSGDELVSRRAQATIAAGLLAFSGVGAPAAVASEPDTVSEGTAEVVDGADPDSFDMGEDTVQLVDEPAPAPGVADPPIDATSLPAEDAEAAPVEEALEAETVETAAEVIDDTAAPPAVAPAAPEPEPTAPPVAEALTVSNAAERSGIRAERSKRVNVRRARTAQTTTPAVTVSAEPPPVAAPATAAPRTVRVVAATSSDQAARGDRVHVVLRGESLWSIASDVLGHGASVARVAREVDRLWELNEDRIGTGSPDLLFTGTRLRLR